MDSAPGIGAFLLTDIVGSTGLWEAYPTEMSEALAEHDRILRREINGHDGEVFSTAGDSFAAVFYSVAQAARAAINAQIEMAKISVADRSLGVRTAIHVGEAIVREGDYFGPTVNRCARLMGIAQGGQILVSEPAARILRTADPAVRLQKIGTFELKGLQAPEVVHQVTDERLQTDFSPPPTTSRQFSNLPPYMPKLFGREDDFRRIKDLMETERVIVITGPAGTGKTRLALQVAAEATKGSDREAWIVDLTPVDSAKKVPETVVRALPVSLHDIRQPSTIITSYLRDRSTILVLDNCEHVLDAVASLVSDLVADCPKLIVLATSRERLGIREEQAYPLGPLETPKLKGHVGPSAPSLQLFVDRARRSDPTFELTEVNREAVAEICRQVDGLPLAIELAAARTSLIPPEQLVGMLDDRLRLLRTDRRDAQPHHRTLTAALDWSYELLSPEDRVLFARLSVFPASFGLGDAITVCSDNDVSEFDALEGLSRLSAKSLLRRTDNGRLNFLETIRQYGLHKLRERDERETFEHRHALHYAELIETLEHQLRADEVETLSKYERERENIHTALARSVEWDNAVGARIYGALRHFWWSHGYPTMALDWGKTLAAKAADPTVINGRALHTVGFVAFKTDPVLANSYIEKAEELLRSSTDVGSTVELSRILISSAAAPAKDLDERQDACEEALELAQKTGDTLGESIALMNLSIIASRKGELTESVSIAHRALVRAREAGQPSRLSEALELVGNTEIDAGHYETARVHLGEALAMADEHGHIPTIMAATHGLLRLALFDRDLIAARKWAHSFLEHIEYALSDSAVQFLVDLAKLLVLLGQRHAAVSTIQYVEKVIEKTGWDMFPQLADAYENLRLQLADPREEVSTRKPPSLKALQAELTNALQMQD